MKRFPNFHRCGGQSLVEFVLCAPLLIIMLFALLDGSAYYRSAMCVRTAATEAATFYTKRPDASDADVKAHVLACVKGTEGSSSPSARRMPALRRAIIRCASSNPAAGRLRM